jgi:hypothetical protein
MLRKLWHQLLNWLGIPAKLPQIKLHFGRKRPRPRLSVSECANRVGIPYGSPYADLAPGYFWKRDESGVHYRIYHVRMDRRD